MYEGYDWDVCFAPFEDVPFVPPEVILGDNWCRFFVRMLEVVQASAWSQVLQSLDKYPDRRR